MASNDDSQPLFRNRYRVAPARWSRWDYRRPGFYHVTICTQCRIRCLGEVVGSGVVLSPYGEVVAREWRQIPRRHPQVTLDESIVMPDHLHGLLILGGLESLPLGGIIGQFKAKVTKVVRSLGHSEFAWQERFHDTIVENLKELNRIRQYIRDNPKRWQSKR
ncbi:MAG: REP-associated tyrosine transposase [Acidobacteriota bacterium]|nr:REP-associated tyrosine transposase [Acidobacteriota bacterium]